MSTPQYEALLTPAEVAATLPAGQLLTVAEMDRAVNDPDDLHFLDIDQLRLVVNHLIVIAPEETAAAICEQQKAAAL